MRVSDVMRTSLATISRDATIAEAVEVLSEAHVSGLPVVDGHRRLIGVLSTTDVLDATAEAASPEERERVFENTLVGDIMTMRPATVLPDQDVMEAARQMLHLDIHRVFVEEHGLLVGVLSQRDVVEAVAAGGTAAGAKTGR